MIGPDINLFRMQAEALLLNQGVTSADVHVSVNVNMKLGQLEPKFSC